MTAPAAPRRAAAYVRVSSVAGREGESFMSPDVQREKIEAWARYRDYTITKWYVDLDVSAFKQNVRRPEFERMMADAREHRFEAVAVYKLTRFARTTKAAATALDELERLGVGLVSVTEDIDTTTAGGKFMRNVFFAMAEFEAERIGEEWRNVHAERRRRGIANVTKHVTGYRDNLMTIEPVEAQAVRKMYALRDAGSTYTSIAHALQVEGYTTRLGHSRFNHATIAGILKNPIYAGMLRGPDGELVEGRHEPLVSREMWDRVQKKAGQARRTNRYRGSLLSGLLVCSGCGYRMQYQAPTVRKSTGYTRNGNYRCPARTRSEPCELHLTIDAPAVEEYVERAFLTRFSAKRMPHGGRLKATRQQREWTTRLARVRGRLDELDRALDNLADQRFVKGSIEAVEYERQAGRFLAERGQLEEQAGDLERMLSTVRPLERNVLDLWDQLTKAEKRRAFAIVIGDITINPAPRRGKAIRTQMPERVDIGWLQ